MTGADAGASGTVLREPTPSLYERVGGMPYFDALLAPFYAGVGADEVLRPLYPEPDLRPAARRLTLFLAQYWGGPGVHSVELGHPRLRMRHAPFPIGLDARDRWLQHMRRSVEASGADPADEAELMAYFSMAAEAIRNLPR